jgi:hypothetical protein
MIDNENVMIAKNTSYWRCRKLCELVTAAGSAENNLFISVSPEVIYKKVGNTGETRVSGETSFAKRNAVNRRSNAVVIIK